MAVSPGQPCYERAYQKQLVNFEGGHISYFRDEDEQMNPFDIPIVIIYNGKHHFCSSKKISQELCESKRMGFMKTLLGNVAKLSICFNKLPEPIQKNINLLEALGNESSKMISY